MKSLSELSQLVMGEERRDTQLFSSNKAREYSDVWDVWLALGIAPSQVTNTGQSRVSFSITPRH